jgi:hypothetical protein
MYYSYVEIEFAATSFSPARTDLALKLLSVIFENVEIFIRIAGLYHGVVPPTCILFLSIVWLFIVIDGKIHLLMCVDTYSLSCIHFLL